MESNGRPDAAELVKDPERRAHFYGNTMRLLRSINRNAFPGGADGWLAFAAAGHRRLFDLPITVSVLAEATGFSRRKVRRLLCLMRDEGYLKCENGLQDIWPTDKGLAEGKRILTDFLDSHDPRGLAHAYNKPPDPRFEDCCDADAG